MSSCEKGVYSYEYMGGGKNSMKLHYLKNNILLFSKQEKYN